MSVPFAIDWRRLLASPEFRARLIFTLGALLLFRLARFIPMPGIDSRALTQVLSGSKLLSAGDQTVRFSIVALSFTPYLSAWPFIELVRSFIGDTRAARFRLYLASAFAAFQAYGIALALASQRSIVAEPGIAFVAGVVATLVASTLFLIWLGDQISRRGLGNGIWVLIAAEFLGDIPGAVVELADLTRTGAMPQYVMAVSMLCFVSAIALIVLFELARRHIPLQRKLRQTGDHAEIEPLAMPLDHVAILPAIFTTFILAFLVWPTVNLPGWQYVFSLGAPAYLALFVPLFILLTFLITALVASPGIEADRLRKAGLAVNGVPESELDRFLDDVMTRLTAIAALYLLAIAVLPMLLIRYFGVPYQIGGMGMLIGVIVALGIFRQCAALSATR